MARKPKVSTASKTENLKESDPSAAAKAEFLEKVAANEKTAADPDGAWASTRLANPELYKAAYGG